MPERRVVITGLGVVAPNGIGVTEFKEALINGRSGITSVDLMISKGFRCNIGGVINLLENQIDQYIPKNHQLRMSKAMIHAWIAACECYQDAGFNIKDNIDLEPNWEMGCIIGNTNNGVELFLESISESWKSNNIKKMGISTVEKTMTSGISAKVAGHLGLGNKVSTNSSACATGTEAIVDGYFHIKANRANFMLCGGAEGGAPYQWSGFDAMRLINSKYNNDPQKASRPFAENGATFVPGEGSAILMLESLDSAQKRGAKIYAEIIGAHSNCGGQRLGGSMTAPNSTAVKKCITSAIQNAKIDSSQIDYINGHLTGTMADPIEVSNWMEALKRDNRTFPYINSTKALIGHGLSAAGALETAATVIQIKENFIHQALNSEILHPYLVPLRDKIPLKTLKYPIKYAAKASFGFGDVNSVLILKAL